MLRWLRFEHSIPVLFIAGFLAVLIFHQGVSTIWYMTGLSPNPPFPTRAAGPLGVPQIWSLAFWGGVWGIVYGLLERYYPDGIKYWVAALVFGALAPTLFGRFVLTPLRGQPINWDLLSAWRGFVINGAWGLGTAAFLRWRP